MEIEEFVTNQNYVREFIRWAWPCMKNLHIYSKEKQLRLAGVWPKIELQVFSAANTGILNKDILLLWEKAVKEVLIVQSSHPMLDYMFGKHNDEVVRLSKYNPEIKICLARAGIFDGKNVIFKSGSELCGISPYLTLKNGDLVGVHLNTVVDLLDKERFKIYYNI